ncbi:MAG: hypothetical protein AAGG55_14700 [Pseudomonadota bacterium]
MFIKISGLPVPGNCIRANAIALLGLLVAACSTIDQLSLSDRELLEQRVEDRWTALVSKDWSAAYRFTSPAYKALVTEGMYQRRFAYMVEWELTSVELLNYDADAAVASVAVRVMSRPVKQTSAASRAIGAVPSTSVEQWILSDGQWWYSANL